MPSKRIGGHFDFSSDELAKKPTTVFNALPKGSKTRWLDTGRSCLALIMQTENLKGKVVFVPEFLCEDGLLEVLRDYRVKIVFYKVDQKFSVNLEEVTALIDKYKCSAIVVVNYFGLNTSVGLITQLKKRYKHCVIIHDCVQAPYYILNGLKKRFSENYVFTSFRKSFPVYDGALLISQRKSLPVVKGQNELLQAFGLQGGMLKQAFLRGASVPEEAYVTAFQNAQLCLSWAPSVISEFSAKTLHHLKFQTIQKIRQENYQYLVKQLKAIKQVQIAYTQLPNAAVPLCCPIYVPKAKRNLLRKYLQNHHIYCPVHWPLTNVFSRKISASSKGIYDTELSLIIDQRYGAEDLNKLAVAIKRFFGHE